MKKILAGICAVLFVSTAVISVNSGMAVYDQADLDISGGESEQGGSENEPVEDGAFDEPMGDVSVDEPVGDVSVDEPVGDVPADEPAEDVPADEPEGDVSEDEPEGDVSEDEPEGDVSADEPVEDVPADEPVGDVPADEPAEDVPADEPAEDGSEDEPAEDEDVTSEEEDTGIMLLAEETSVTKGDFTITGENLTEWHSTRNPDGDYSFSSSTLTIKSNKSITISTPDKTSESPTANKIVVESPEGANITLSGVNIKCTGNSTPFEITNGGKGVTVTLDDGTTNTLEATQNNYAGLQKTDVNCKLIINGNGSLAATGGTYAAGIGGGGSKDGSNITIEGGTIIATGGNQGAGIGGGGSSTKGYNGTNIKITGGNVTAIGGNASAGIGGGGSNGSGIGGSGTGIAISGSGTVTATGGSNGAGIGGGTGGSNYNGGDGGDSDVVDDDNNIVEFKGIAITGSVKVTATGTGGGAGIGGGYKGKSKNIKIETTKRTDTGSDDENYNIKAIGGNTGGAGIGGGAAYGNPPNCIGGDATNITITGSGTVIANGGGQSEGGAGIGGGVAGNGDTITIDLSYGGCVKATGGSYPGYFEQAPDYFETADDATKNTQEYKQKLSSSGGAGIGGGTPKVNTWVGVSRAGGNGTNITISGSGTVEAMGGKDSAGIGGGGLWDGQYAGNGTGITIKGGTVIATGKGMGSAGIGGGGGGSTSTINSYSQGEITITGGNITAIGGGTGIGAGSYNNGTGSSVTIANEDNDGDGEKDNISVTAIGSNGIYGKNITISGDKKIIGEEVVEKVKVEATGTSGSGISSDIKKKDDKEDILILAEGTITISGGDITAKGDTPAYSSVAGIDGSTITISGGKVDATGGGGGTPAQTSQVPKPRPAAAGAGISGGTITITGGEVTATGGEIKEDMNGKYGGAGIDGTEITIEGEETVVTANGKNNGAGITSCDTIIYKDATKKELVTVPGKGSITIDGGKNITINGGNDGGAGIGTAAGAQGEMTVTINDGTVTANGGGGGAGIGGGEDSTGKLNITIEKGTVIADSHSGGGAGIGGGNGSSGDLEVTINGGDVTATGSICLDFNGGAGIGEGSNSKMTENSNLSVTITNGTVHANGNGDNSTGIGGNHGNVTVNIAGESETSFPWVYTNEITRDNNDKYNNCVIFDEQHKTTYTEEVGETGETYAPDGIVYGDIKLTEDYTLESGELLRVHSDGKLTTNGKLTLEDGSVLYLEQGAELVKYQDVKGYTPNSEGGGKILHEDNASPDTAQKSCTICGSRVPHQWSKDWKYNNTHHWHNCDSDNCSVLAKATACSITENSEKDGYGEHVADENNPDKVEEVTIEGVEKIKRTYICKTCGYEYYKLADKNKPTPDPIPTETTPTETTPTETTPTETTPTETTPTETTPTETAPTETAPTETTPTETTPTETTTPGTGGRPNFTGAPNIPAQPEIQTVSNPNEPAGSEDISMGSGLWAGAVNAVKSDKFIAVPPIVISIATAVSAFAVRRRRKK